MRWQGFAVYGAVLAVSLALFYWAPQVDLFVSGLFFSPTHGFTLAEWPPIKEFTRSIRWIAWAILLIALAGAVWLRLMRQPLWRFDRNALIFLVAALAIGPGILVNTVLKDHWGRARPYQIEAFGGQHEFTAAPLPANQCDRNCSFVSGHAALGFSLVMFAFLMPGGRPRNIALATALSFGALVGLARIAAGHHFLSDIVDAGLLVVGTTWLLHWWLVVHDGATPIIATAGRLSETQNGQRVLWVIAFVLAEFVAIVWVDRPVADFFHKNGGAVQPFFMTVQWFGLGYPYLLVTGLAFVFLRWGGEWERLRPRAEAMRAVAYIPGFIFLAVGGAGLIADLLKILIGRTRPKLLFDGGAYDFTWFGLRADHWSFPSGHATTAAALMTALWCLWPRPLWLYIAAAALVATSRVITDQHYLSDVIAGTAIGVVVTRVIALWLLRQRDGAGPGQRNTAHDAAPASRAV
ncbi:MAG TPA: phosphatase PAP2 family protein [Stellaceae bacterium]|jgi:lipid A 4'-phosphatase|nr:phosphatase PAP2 family protein [Stellaceae bacterium]